jgi:hypothetical protein
VITDGEIDALVAGGEVMELPPAIAYDCEAARRIYERQINRDRNRVYVVDRAGWRRVWRMLLVDGHDPGDEDTESCAAWRGGEDA